MKKSIQTIFSEEEKKEFVRSFIMKFSRGNILLQIGKFITKKEADKKCRQAAEYDLANL